MQTPGVRIVILRFPSTRKCNNRSISAGSILAQLAENNALKLPNSELPLCVQDWTKNRPTVEAINGVIELLKLETNFFVQLQEEMERWKTVVIILGQIQRDVATCTVTAKEQKVGDTLTF